ncbi:HAMP domain-containing histidine kinase [Micromonospora sp. ATA51]|nr:HAMP domain-containing sensor histidine kinase [Micromonospora sp. ATA51]MBM0227729.1 HAMP domain-containing histidine kinase [Micromonospora sp. ATA51]
MRTQSTDRLLAGVWINFAAFNVALMWLLPGQETVPFHLVWISLSLVYGFTNWSLSWMVLALVGVTTSTGAILVHHAAVGEIRWEETTEEPLMAVIFIVMAWHVHRRHLLLREMRRIGDAERDRAHRQELLVRVASHELRTPLTIARGYTELLRSTHDDESTTEDTAVVLDELDKATRIAHRLVTLMQLEQPHQVRPVDLDAELARIARRWAPAAERSWSARSSVGLTRVDPERLEAALDCLIENAVKFTVPVTGSRWWAAGTRRAGRWRWSTRGPASRRSRCRTCSPGGRDTAPRRARGWDWPSSGRSPAHSAGGSPSVPRRVAAPASACGCPNRPPSAGRPRPGRNRSARSRSTIRSGCPIPPTERHRRGWSGGQVSCPAAGVARGQDVEGGDHDRSQVRPAGPRRRRRTHRGERRAGGRPRGRGRRRPRRRGPRRGGDRPDRRHP